MLYQKNLWDEPSATSSPASVSGPTPCDSPAGETTGKCGPEVARVSLSPRQAGEKGLLTSDTCGRPGSISSSSAALQSYLESRLRPALQSNGSTLFTLTWKQLVTPSGRSYCLLRASAPRTADTAYSSWPTPIVNDDKGSMYCYGPKKPDGTRPIFWKLPGAAKLATWPTPQAFDATSDGMPKPLRYKGNAPSEQGNTRDPSKPGSYRGDLKDYAGLASWPTPSATDGKGSSQIGQRKGQLTETVLLATMLIADSPARLTATGGILIGSDAAMESGGQLNPALPRWLMGLPPEWCEAAIRASKSMPRRKRGQ